MSRARSAATKSVIPTTAGTAEDLLEVYGIETEPGRLTTKPMMLVGITITNPNAPGTAAQAHVGIQLSGASSWAGEIVSPYLDGGEVFAWEGRILLNKGDIVQSYASVTDTLDVTIETEDI